MRLALLWLAMFTFVCLGVLFEGGHLSAFVQGTAAMIVLLPIFSYTIYFFGWMGSIDFFRRALGGRTTDFDHQFINIASTLGFLFAALGGVAGMIHLLENIAEPSKLGAGVAVSFISAIYGLIPAVMLLPIRKLNSGTRQMSTPLDSQLKKAAGFMVATFLMLGGTLMTIMWAVRR